MDGTDPGAGQHRVGRLGHHRHVNANTITGTYAPIMHDIGQTADLVLKHLIGNVLALTGIIAFPQYGCLISAMG